MLQEYREEYEEFYTIINNAIKEQKINHAYMFEIDDSLDQDKFIKDICKALILGDCNDRQNIDVLIDNDSYPNIKRVKNDGLWIKKESINEIQRDFSKKSFDDNLKIYVIEDAAKLNKSSANTLLKFLEEPDEGIVAILLTNNKYSVINTIVSRCTNISLKRKKSYDLTRDDISYKVVDIIEKKGDRALPYLYQLLVNNNFDRNKLFDIFLDVQKIYSDILNINNDIDSKYNYFTDGVVNDLCDDDSAMIVKKIDVISRNIKYLKNNVNIKTILDKIVFDVYGGE